MQFYNIERPRCWVIVKLGEQSHTSAVGIGLDPTWEENITFTVKDPATEKVEAKFMIKCEKNGNEQQLGDVQTFALDKLITKKQTYKGLVVPGGKADFMFTATNFGEEDVPEEDGAFMDFL